MADDDIQSLPKIGVIVRPPDAGGTDSMEGFARILQGQGYLVRGLVQRNSPAPDACACTMTLVDLLNGQEFRISQDLGSGSVCCRIDTQAIADATSVLREAVEAETHLLIVNKFGKLEAQGRGMVDEMLAAAAKGIPLLTSVEAALLEHWRAFTGGIAEELGPGCGSLLRWWESVRPRGVARPAQQRRGSPQGDGDGEPAGDQPFQRIEPVPETS